MNRRFERRSGSPQGFRIILLLFTFRVLLGLGFFVYLIYMARGMTGPFVPVLLLLTAVYAAYAIYGFVKNLGQYRRSRLRAALGADRTTAEAGK